MKKVTIISNPFSGTSDKKKLEDLLQAKNNGSIDLKVIITERAGHGFELAKQEVALGTDIIVAAGGDGTVNEIAKAVAGSRATLGILPGGSGNGFAMHLGLGRDMIKAFDYILEGHIMTVDTCMVNNIFFINLAGLGLDAKVAYLTKHNKKRGFYQYLKSTIQQAFSYEPLQLKITTDGGVIEGKFAAAVVANASMYGYNFVIAPTAALDDGLFDVMLIKDASVLKYLLEARRMLTKTMDKSSLAINIKSKQVKIESKGNKYFHVDGEGFMTADDLTFEIKRDNINVIVRK